jgi:putative transcription factor
VGRVERADKKKASPVVAVLKKPADFSDDDWELVENYGGVVKGARERMNLKQEELAKKINEPESLVHRIESGHDRPNPDVARKLERALRVKLMAERDLSGIELTGGGKGEVTLGDVVVVRKKSK